MAVGQWRIQVRQPNLALVGEFSTWANLAVTTQRNVVGSFSFDVKADDPLAAYLVRGNGVVIERLAPGATAYTTVLSGPLRSLKRQWDQNGDIITASGPDDLVWFQDRLASNVPSAGAPPYDAQAYDVRTGTCSTMIWQYVNVNAGPGAVASRQIPGLTLASDPALGTTVTGRARWQVLLELLQSLAIAGGDLQFTCKQSATTGQLVFTIAQSTDRSGTVVFSPALGNVAAFAYQVDAPTADNVIAGDASTGTSRLFYQQSDPVAVADWGSIEGFRSQTDTTNVAEMQQALLDELTTQGEKTTTTVTTVDTAATRWQRDYDLGDVVTVDLFGNVFSDTIQQVAIKVTEQDAELVRPTIGTTAAVRQTQTRFFADLKSSKTRLSLVQRQ